MTNEELQIETLEHEMRLRGQLVDYYLRQVHNQHYLSSPIDAAAKAVEEHRKVRQLQRRIDWIVRTGV